MNKGFINASYKKHYVNFRKILSLFLINIISYKNIVSLLRKGIKKSVFQKVDVGAYLVYYFNGKVWFSILNNHILFSL